MSTRIEDPVRAAEEAAADYAPGQGRPLRGYVVLAGTFATAFGGSLVALRASGRELPERFDARDVVMIGVATHKLSRVIAKDKVTSFLRAPFTRFQEPAGQGEVEEEARGSGVQLAVGELLICPYCLGMWVASGFTLGIVRAPRFTRLLGTIFVAHTISDFLQVASRAAGEEL